MALVGGTAYHTLTQVPNPAVNSAIPIQQANSQPLTVAPDTAPAEPISNRVWREVPQPEIHDQFANLDIDGPQPAASFGPNLPAKASDQARAVVTAMTAQPSPATHLAILNPAAPQGIAQGEQPAKVLDQPIATKPATVPAEQNLQPKLQVSTASVRLSTIAPATALDPTVNSKTIDPIATADAAFATLTPSEALPLGQDAQLVFQVASQVLDQNLQAMNSRNADDPTEARFAQLGTSNYFAVRDLENQRIVIFARRASAQLPQALLGTNSRFQNDDQNSNLLNSDADQQNEMLEGLEPVMAIDLVKDQPVLSLNRLTRHDIAAFQQMQTRLSSGIALAPTRRDHSRV